MSTESSQISMPHHENGDPPQNAHQELLNAHHSLEDAYQVLASEHQSLNAECQKLRQQHIDMEKQLQMTAEQARAFSEELNMVYHSHSWRIGRMLTYPVREAKSLLRKCKEQYARFKPLECKYGFRYALKKFMHGMECPETSHVYSVLLSLGVNCEISFHLGRIFGFVDSYPLSWAFIHNVGTLPRLISSPCDLMKNPVFEHDYSVNMCRHAEFNINFHCQGTPASLLDEQGKVIESRAEAERQELKSRLTHLCSKWEALLKDPERSLLCILTIWEDTSLEYVLAVNDALKKYPQTDLLVVLTGKERYVSGRKLKKHGIFVRYVTHHPAPVAATDLSKNDVKGWNCIFDEFRPAVFKESNKVYKYEK